MLVVEAPVAAARTRLVAWTGEDNKKIITIIFLITIIIIICSYSSRVKG